VLPAIYLNTSAGSTGREWLPKRDLLNSGRNAKEFVVEVEADGTAILRFGDNQHGLRPPSATPFYATYRVGNGKAGNVGAESLVHVVSSESAITAVRNPLPAAGGVEAETIKQALQNAPSAFRTQERAVTTSDYAAKTELHSQVQQAAATFRWTGSWYTVFLTVDRLGGLDVDAAFETSVRDHIERYRMAGHDVEVDGPRFVPLEIEMHVCADPDYFRSDVKAALMEVFSTRTLPDGRQGAFHPDNFTFGQSVYLSKLYAAAQAVTGVASVQIKTFQRQDVPSDVALKKGEFELGRLEIARLDNDPNYPKHGVFRVTVGGGK
jgi:predicted phage baseplate assembly protein